VLLHWSVIPATNLINSMEVDSLTIAFQGTSENPERIHASGFSFAGFPWPFFAILFLSASISLLWSHCSLLTNDELLELWTDRISSLGQIVHVQLTGPISVDPILYHAIAHGAIRIFGANPFALRLPSLIGFLMMQVCLFVFVRRLASERAAVIAMVFPALTLPFFFSLDGRPYGMMLGLLGVAMVSWQSAICAEARRLVPLILLALSLAMILNTHYSGVLLFAPFCIAEVFRTCQRRRLDLPVATAICMGGAGIVFALPLMKAALQHRDFYYFPRELLKPPTIIWTYLRLLSPTPQYFFGGVQMSARSAIVLVILAFALWGFILRWRRRAPPRLDPEMVFLAVLTALPFFSFLMARFVTHTFEERYSLSMVVGLAAFTGIGMSMHAWGKRTGNLILIAFLVAIVLFGTRSILNARSATQEAMSAMTVSPEAKAALMASSSKQFYIQNLQMFARVSYYEKDPYIRAHLSLVFSREQEIRWHHMDTVSMAALHMINFTQFNIVSFETLTTLPGDHLFVVYPETSSSQFNWIGRALAAAHAEVKPVGHAFGGDVVSVRFRP
jgi:4-amino-4-deoxy-L-arabinose transferase-like glycosyltransferase